MTRVFFLHIIMLYTKARSLLGITSSIVTEKDLRKAYRKKSRTCHPDKPGGSNQAFQKLQEAYHLLSNKHKALIASRVNKPQHRNYYPNEKKRPSKNRDDKGFNSPENIKKRRTKLEMHQEKAIEVNKFYEEKYWPLSDMTFEKITHSEPVKGKVRCACGAYVTYASLHKATCPIQEGPLRAAAFAVANGVINDNATLIIHSSGKYTFFEVQDSFPL